MADCCSPTFLFVLIRTVHFATCLLLLAVWAFDRLVLPAVTLQSESFLRRWHKLLMQSTLFLLPLIATSGGAWFVQLCVNMSGLSLREAMHPETIRTVWNGTSFGRLWQVRSILWLAWLYAPLELSLRMPRIFRSMSAWFGFMLAGALVSSLAWAGHGQDGGAWHLLADAIHLFIAGLWPTGLAPFLVSLMSSRNLPAAQRRAIVIALTYRFSTMSLISVGLLAITGVINGLYLIRNMSDLVGTNYGKLLVFKVSLFVVMLILGAVNLIRLKPRLSTTETDVVADGAALALKRNVAVELSLGLTILIVTAALGLLAPSSSG